MDHRALHASTVRTIRWIKHDAIVKDLDKFSIDQTCVDVGTMVKTYERLLSELLDKRVPLKNIMVVDRPLNKRMTDNILALKAMCRKNWLISCITMNFNIYYDSCMIVRLQCYQNIPSPLLWHLQKHVLLR